MSSVQSFEFPFSLESPLSFLSVDSSRRVFGTAKYFNPNPVGRRKAERGFLFALFLLLLRVLLEGQRGPLSAFALGFASAEVLGWLRGRNNIYAFWKSFSALDPRWMEEGASVDVRRKRPSLLRAAVERRINIRRPSIHGTEGEFLSAVVI